MAQTTPYSVKHYVEESKEASGLSLAREICQAFNISQSINYLKHLKCLCFIKLRSYLISVFLTSLHWKKPAKNNFFSQLCKIGKNAQEYTNNTIFNQQVLVSFTVKRLMRNMII